MPGAGQKARQRSRWSASRLLRIGDGEGQESESAGNSNDGFAAEAEKALHVGCVEGKDSLWNVMSWGSWLVGFGGEMMNDLRSACPLE